MLPGSMFIQGGVYTDFFVTVWENKKNRIRYFKILNKLKLNRFYWRNNVFYGRLGVERTWTVRIKNFSEMINFFENICVPRGFMQKFGIPGVIGCND